MQDQGITESRRGWGWKGSKRPSGVGEDAAGLGWSLKSFISCILCGNGGLQAPRGSLGIKIPPERALDRALKNQHLAAETPRIIPGKQLHQDLLTLPNTISFHLISSFPGFSLSSFLPPSSGIIILVRTRLN